MREAHGDKGKSEDEGGTLQAARAPRMRQKEARHEKVRGIRGNSGIIIHGKKRGKHFIARGKGYGRLSTREIGGFREEAGRP